MIKLLSGISEENKEEEKIDANKEKNSIFAILRDISIVRLRGAGTGTGL